MLLILCLLSVVSGLFVGLATNNTYLGIAIGVTLLILVRLLYEVVASLDDIANAIENQEKT